jgi:hypothetical protein
MVYCVRYTEVLCTSPSTTPDSGRDFEAIGQKRPKGNGVDAMVENSTLAPPRTAKKRRITTTIDIPKQDSIIKVLELVDVREAKMSALRMFLEFGLRSEQHQEQGKRRNIYNPPLPVSASSWASPLL